MANVEVRCADENLPVYERGLSVTFFRLARGVDGVYEMYFESDKPIDLPAASAEPAVPLAE